MINSTNAPKMKSAEERKPTKGELLEIRIAKIVYAGGRERPSDLVVAELNKELLAAHKAGMTEAAEIAETCLDENWHPVSHVAAGKIAAAIETAASTKTINDV